jgi:prophage regulatory protein
MVKQMQREDSEAASLVIPREGFLRLPQVLQFVPVSKTVWWDGVKRGIYPPSVKLGARVTAWRAGDIRELVERLSAPAPATKA